MEELPEVVSFQLRPCRRRWISQLGKDTFLCIQYRSRERGNQVPHMRKLLFGTMVAGLLLAFVALIGSILHDPGPNESQNQTVAPSNPNGIAQSDAPLPEASISPQSDASNSAEGSTADPLGAALASYDAMIQAMARSNSDPAWDENTEFLRRRRTLESLLLPRIEAAMKRKYRRRPPFQNYPLVTNNLVDTIYTSTAPCKRCMNIDYEIDVPSKVIDEYLPYDPYRFGLHCWVTMYLAPRQGDDEATVKDIEHNYCFEPISHTPDREQDAQSLDLR